MGGDHANGAIGRSELRKEDQPLITGSGCFVDDLHLPGTAHAAILRSPHAHAEIVSIDAQQALADPGVHDVITADDLPADLRIPMRMHSVAGMEQFLQPPLARATVRYSGEPVAVVVAESRYVAEDALEKIAVDYRPLTPVLEGPAALEDGAPTLFADSGRGNLAAEFEVAYGALEDAFESAAVVIEETLALQRHAAVPLEPRGLAAEIDPRTGGLVLWGAAKIVHINRGILAKMLGLSEERLRLVELHVGGGFGARGEIYPEDFLIPFCALRLGRPVSWTCDREEDLRSTNHSREQVHEIAIALGDDGEFLGLRDRFTFNTGAYIRTHGTVVPSMTAGMLPGPYRWGAYRCLARQVVTNKTPAGTYRAPGRYEANFARERIIDIAAHRLDLDPAEIRRRNLITADQMPYVTGTQIFDHPISYDSGDYPLLQRKALERFDYEAMVSWRDAQPELPRRRGIGLGFFVEKSAIADWDYARVDLNSEGRLVVRAGAASVGQGVETVLAQICAEGLGVRYEDIAEVRHGDTDDVYDGMGAFGSRATAMAGAAVMRASEALQARILTEAADMLEAAPADLEIRDGGVRVRGSADRSVSLAEIAAAAKPAKALGRGAQPGLIEETYFYSDEMSFPYGLHCAAVEVDCETGGVEIARYGIAYDVGRAVNPMLVEGQIVGGLMQGVGGALLEELAYGDDGQLLAGSFIDYLLPTAGESVVVDVLITEDAPSPLSPIGVKGAGEGGTAAAGAALANAVSDALGVEALELPLSPERVRALAAPALATPAPAPRG